MWREALLAQAVLRGKTKGYRNHPQLERFRKSGAQLTAIAVYLSHIHAEASGRGYNFDKTKIGRPGGKVILSVTMGQLSYERGHLLKKLAVRSKELYELLLNEADPAPHPLFVVKPGQIESWEKSRSSHGHFLGT